MEWLKRIFSYSELEKSLLNSSTEPSLFTKYSETVSACGEEIHIVNAPASNNKKIALAHRAIFVHGLGGNALCFAHIGESIDQFCGIVVIDLPGSGKSPPAKDKSIYNPFRLVELINEVIEITCKGSPFVMIGHSYGTTHCLRVATGRLKDQCLGVICISPPFHMPLSPYLRTTLRYTPVTVFNTLFRSRDRVGGLYSPSVNRMVSTQASTFAREQQMRINLHSDSSVVLETIIRMQFYDPEIDFYPSCPVLVICASDDKVCPTSRSKELYETLKEHTAAEFYEISNAGHAVLFERYEIISGVVSSFFADKVDERLSLSWQLRHLASMDDKWSLKNEEKWKNLEPVSDFVGDTFFKGMKVLREGDAIHSPAAFEKLHPEVRFIIDISREVPPYDPATFNRVEYTKYPTVSKVPPSKIEVNNWIALVNDLRKSLNPGEAIGVHCHYGFNRTGFFVCSYLVQQLNYTVAAAIDAYAKARPPGMRHQHFINELYVRYE